MKLFLILVELNPKCLEGDILIDRVLQKFLEARVQGALGFRGEVVDSKFVEGSDRWRIEKLLTGQD